MAKQSRGCLDDPSTWLWCECDVVVQELPYLHEHVGGPGPAQLLLPAAGVVQHLAQGPRVGELHVSAGPGK